MRNYYKHNGMLYYFEDSEAPKDAVLFDPKKMGKHPEEETETKAKPAKNKSRAVKNK